jgi:penicillin amidase
MKLLKKILLGLLLVIVLLAAGLWVYTFTLRPDYNGELELANLNEEVTVYFDNIGVPHINAQNQEDAYRALGYLHAQDRLWQMELIRRIAPGRLSEIFGKDLVETDAFFKGLGIEENAQKSIAKLDKSSAPYILTEAYLDGINQFIENGFTPIEFQLLGIEKTKYTIQDVYHAKGYMAFSFAHAHKADPLLTEIKEKLGAEYLKEMNIPIDAQTALLKTEKNPIIKDEVAKAMDRIFNKLPISPFIGSNSWVIGPEKTKNGKVLFANDPHIGFSQPSVWYQSHIKTPDFELYGYNIALTPFALLGHNREYAYGLTMFENDDLDFFFEENNPNNPDEYKTPEGYQPYKKLEKTVVVKDAPDTTFTVKVSKHGPIMNDLIKQINHKRPIAMQWMYTKLENQILDVAYTMSHSKSLEQFKSAAEKLHAPGLNIMYGDAKNNIAWFASGKLYKYRDSVSSLLILDGASGKDEVQEYLDFEKNPQAINPSWQYVYSANNQTDSIDGYYYPGYYLPEDRGDRIQQLLEAKNDWTKEDVMEMIFDVTSNVVVENIMQIRNSLDKGNLTANEREALKILLAWNGRYGKEEVAPTIYTKVIYNFMEATFADELGDSFESFLKTGGLMKKMIATQLNKSESVWWDDISTDAKEGKSEVIQAAFAKSITDLETQLGTDVTTWQWQKVASVEHGHALAKGGAMLRNAFNVGPFLMDGGNEVINNQLFQLNGDGTYKVIAGPSTRRVIDFSDIENSMSVLPTGQSGNVFSDHYDDQADHYLNGNFFKMMLNQEEIEKSENILVLKKKH